jgi:hemoglobin/transferrin/lactoferrin receptor protein
MGSTGYRTPNVDDVSKVFDSEPGRVIVPNPDLMPEYTYNVDLHITHAITDQAQADFTVWATSFRNALTVLPGSFNGQDSIEYNGEWSEVVQLSNAGKAYLYGVTGSLQADLNRFLSFSTGLSYTYGRIKSDTLTYPQDHIPPLYGRTSMNLQLNKFRGSFAVLYNGWKRIEEYNIIGGEDNEQYATPYGMPAWYTLNLKASYSLSDTWTLQGGIDNITDLHYRVFASGVSAPGRNIYLTVRAFM